MTSFPQGSSVQNYENMQNHQKASGLSDESFAKNLNIPRGFPSVIMTFGDFKNWKALTKLLKVPPIPKVPTNRDQFKKDLNQAETDFFNEKGRNALTERIVFEVKQAIARFHVIDTQVAHINMEYTRGDVEVLVTRGDVEVLVSGRTRNIIDHNGSVIIPALSNGIRVFPDNSFIDDSTTKFYGLSAHLYSLFTYSLRDNWFRFSLELYLSPWRYCIDPNMKDKIQKVAQMLGIKEDNIDFTPLEIRKGIKDMLNGAVYEASRLYEKNYAKFNLPPKVQVLLIEECVHLQNVCHLLVSNQKGCFKNKVALQTNLRIIIRKNLTLQEFLGVIYEHEKNNSFGEYLFKESAPLIKSYLQNFIIDPLLQIEGVHGNIFTDGSLTPQETSQNALKFYEEQREWLQNLINTSKSFLFYQDTKNKLDKTN